MGETKDMVTLQCIRLTLRIVMIVLLDDFRIMPDNPARAPHATLENNSLYAEDGRFCRLSFNDDFMTSQPGTLSVRCRALFTAS